MGGMGGKEEAREGGWSKGGKERGREEGEGGRYREGGREGGRWEAGRPYMCKHVAGKIVKQYYSIQCHLSVSISG